MAAPSRILALNLGSQTIGMAEFRAGSGGGLVLQGFRQTDLPGDPTAETSRPLMVQSAIAELVGELGVRAGTSVNYGLSAQSVFTRFVKLPSVVEEKVEQIIQFEAQQNVPFPISEVVWDYQLVDTGDKAKIEVVLVAIKADLLGDLNGAVEGARLKPNVVDVAPMALYNAFRYNYSDVTGCSLLVDIGARTTNLIFVEPKRVFSRSIPIGGASITGAIAKELELPYPVAEERKRAEGFVGLGGAYADPADPDVARMSKLIRNTMTRLHMEIGRSISFYRAQQQGSQPLRVFLCGGSANLPYMREFFSEKLQLPIEYFNPLRNVSVASGVDANDVVKKAHALGELVGLALRTATDCPMELSLRPPTVIKEQTLAARKPFLIAAGLALLAALAAPWFFFQRTAQLKDSVVEQLNQKVAGLKAFEAKFEKERKDYQRLEREAVPFLDAVRERDYWVRTAEEIHQRLPERFIWLTLAEPGIRAGGKFNPITPEVLERRGLPDAGRPAPAGNQKPGQPEQTNAINAIRLRGLYLDNPRQAAVVDNFVENLSQSPMFDKPDVERRSPPLATAWAYDFEIIVPLKQPLPLR